MTACLFRFLVVCSSIAFATDAAAAQQYQPLRTEASRPQTQLRPTYTGLATSPYDGETDVALTRETVLEFSAPIAPATIHAGSVFAEFGGSLLDAQLHVSQDATRVTLFYTEPLPANATVRVTVSGADILDYRGFPVDADGDDGWGGTLTFDFATLSITPIAGTAVCGRVFASELAAVGGGSVNVPLEGVTISVDGQEDILFAVTDSLGNFRLEPCPGGKFFVHVDGATATGIPPGGTYPTVGKAWTPVPGEETNVGEIYLPFIVDGTLQPVDAQQPTTIEFPTSVLQDFPELAGTEVVVPANGLFADDGTYGGMVGIAPVDPDRLPGPLPPELSLPIVITVQTDGPTNFDGPVPVVFPNLPDPDTGLPLDPGAASTLWSFDHDKGAWAPVGSMTVSPDGQFVISDPGVGIVAPGWHGSAPGFQIRTRPRIALAGVGGEGDCYLLIAGGALAGVTLILGCSASAATLGISCVAAKWAAGGIFGLFALPCAVPGDSDDPLLDFATTATPILADVLDEALTYFTPAGPTQADLDTLQMALAELEQALGGDPVAAAQALVPLALDVVYEGFGQGGLDHEVYYCFAVEDIFIRGMTNSNGILESLVSSDAIWSPILFYDPLVPRLGLTTVVDPATAPSVGGTTILPNYLLVEETGLVGTDTDMDGLSDSAEVVIGTQLLTADTDGDGILDGAEVELGLDPLDGLIAQTGIIATAGTPGSAADVSAFDDLVLVATGEGVTLFNVFNGMSPLVVAQVPTPGDARAAALFGERVVVADGPAGLVVIDYSDPPAAGVVLQKSVGAEANAVAVFAGVAYLGLESGTLLALEPTTGATLAVVDLGAPVEDLFVTGDVLYAATSSALSTLPLLQPTLQVAGSVALPVPVLDMQDNRVFVAGGVAYVTIDTGYVTVDVTDPAQPFLIAGPSSSQLSWRELVTTPAQDGVLGLAAVGLNPSGPPVDFEVYDVGDPAITNDFQFAFATPGLASAVDLYNGLAYVADGVGGLQVVNYLQYDGLGLPPAVAHATTPTGPDVEEGTLVRVVASADDDVQVRNVELWIDGEPVQTDGNFPHELTFEVPPLAEQSSVTVQVRASDTGGNASFSALETLQILPDATPPTVVGAVPGEDTHVTESTLESEGIQLTFSERIDPGTLSPASVHLDWAGPDGSFGTSDDAAVPISTLPVDTGLRLLVGVADAPVGGLRLTLDGSLVTDPAGNPLDGDADGSAGGDFVLSISVAANGTVIWVADASGTWSDGSKWNTGAAPAAGNDVIVHRPGVEVTVTVSGGAPAPGSLLCSESLTLAGGTFSVSEPFQVGGSLTLAGGTLADSTLLGVGGQATVTASSALASVVLHPDLFVNQSLILTATGGLTLHGTLTVPDSSRLVLDGTQTLGGPGEVHLQVLSAFFGSYTQFVEMQNGVVTIGPDLTIRGSGQVTAGGGAFVNQGTIRAEQPDVGMFVVGTGWTNEGVIEAASGPGIEIFGGAWTNTGSVVSQAGSSMSLNAGLWTNTGSLVSNGSTINLLGSFPLSQLGSVTFDGGTVNLQGTLQSSTLDVTGATWNLAGGTLDGCSVVGSGPLGITASSFADACTFDADAAFSVEQVSLTVTNGLVLNGSLTVGDNASLVFAGAQSLTGSGEVVLNLISAFFNPLTQKVLPQGGLLTIGPDILIHGSGIVGQAGESFVNLGTIRADFPGAELLCTGPGWSNAGSLEAAGNGVLRTDGSSWTNDGVLTASGSTVTIDVTNWTNNGSFSTVASTVNLQGTFPLSQLGSYAFDGTVNLQGTVPSSILDVTGVTWNLAGGTLDGGSVVGSGALNVTTSSSLVGVTVNADLDITPDTTAVLTVTNGLELNGSLNVPDNTTLRFSGAQTLSGSGEVVLELISAFFNPLTQRVEPQGGLLTIGSGITIRGSGVLGAAGESFVNQGTVRAEVPGAALRLIGTGNVNQGTYETAGGLLESLDGWTNEGLVSLAGSFATTGDLVQSGAGAEVNLLGGALTVSGTLDVQAGALSGEGTVTGAVVNSSEVRPGGSAGILSIDGAYTQTSSGVLFVEIGGLLPGTGGHDQLAISGAAALDGTLQVDMIGGFVPTVGSTFTVLTSSSLGGDFAATVGLDGGAAYLLVTAPGATAYDLVSVPAGP